MSESENKKINKSSILKYLNAPVDYCPYCGRHFTWEHKFGCAIFCAIRASKERKLETELETHKNCNHENTVHSELKGLRPDEIALRMCDEIEQLQKENKCLKKISVLSMEAIQKTLEEQQRRIDRKAGD